MHAAHAERAFHPAVHILMGCTYTYLIYPAYAVNLAVHVLTGYTYTHLMYPAGAAVNIFSIRFVALAHVLEWMDLMHLIIS
jgi:hypothetical protein